MNIKTIKQKIKNAIFRLRFAPITERVVDTHDSYMPVEIEYKDRRGRVVGYWAYGAWEPEGPFKGQIMTVQERDRLKSLRRRTRNRVVDAGAHLMSLVKAVKEINETAKRISESESKGDVCVCGGSGWLGNIDQKDSKNTEYYFCDCEEGRRRQDAEINVDKFTRILKQVLELRNLKPNWNSYGALPPNNGPVIGAIEAVIALRKKGVYPDRVSATDDRCVILEYEHLGMDYYWEFDEDGEVGVLKKKPGQEEEIEEGLGFRDKSVSVIVDYFHGEREVETETERAKKEQEKESINQHDG